MTESRYEFNFRNNRGAWAMSEKCIDHLAFTEQKCPDCGDDVDVHGNTENQMDYCAFPDCGCDGAQHCMTGEPNLASSVWNVEKGSLPRAAKQR